MQIDMAPTTHEVVIVGGGAAGISVEACLLARTPDLDIAILVVGQHPLHQPGWRGTSRNAFCCRCTGRPG